ncbi:MAG: alginate export family protein [Verrucomicrobia bacterium]|nr:alginate export family protein [Verrucomicrobiota bacterium]
MNLLSSSALVLAATAAVYGQHTVPSRPPSGAGLVNDWLRERDPHANKWDVGGQFRVRYEAREHLAVAGVPGAIDFRAHGAPTHDNDYWLFRTKLHMGYSPLSWLRVYVEGRDSFSEGDERVPNLESDRADLHQAYVALGDTKQSPLLAKVGRQELAYGDERLMSSFDWNNIARVFDAAKLRFEHEKFWVDGFAGRVVVPDDNNFNEPNNHDWFWGAYGGTKALVPKAETQLYFLGRNASAEAAGPDPGALIPLPTERDIYSVGTRVKSLPGQLKGWDYGAEVVYQFGEFRETNTGPELDQDAWAAHVMGGYTFASAPASPRVGLEYNFSSGDADPTDGRHQTLDNLFPTNHKFYGYMDLFSWQNIHNPRINLTLKPAKGLTLTVDYHLFWLADTADYFYQANGNPRRGGAAGAGYDRNQGHDNFVGSEIDVIVTYAPKPYLNLQAGYGHFFVGDYVEQSLGSPAFGSSDADWLYLQAAFNF